VTQAYFWVMFVRKKLNKSGLVSIQVIEKVAGKSTLVKTIGSSCDPAEIEDLFTKGKQLIPVLKGQTSFYFDKDNEEQLVNLFFNGIRELSLVGPELLLGKLFNEIGFNAIKDELFRHLVLTRLCYPVSKLKTTDYLFKYRGISIDVESVYRYLDKLNDKQKEQIQNISYRHTLKVLNNEMSIVFYDVTTLYFETEQEDELRKTGFSKDGKHQQPQIVLGLLVSTGGYPLAYEMFEGKKFEGHTMLPVIEAFKAKYKLQKMIVIADAGLMSNDNITELQNRNYEYIIGARIKNETKSIEKQILSAGLKNGESIAIVKDENSRVIISYSDARAKKDAANRKRGLEKLEKNITKGKLTKQHINNRGYNKYLKLEGDIKISIDKEKYSADAKWDGLKGYSTNTALTKEEIIDNYNHLWHIEKAFRISKTDLRIRPIFHRLKRRIEAHICIAFCAYKVYKELERQLKKKKANLSPEKAIEIAKTIYKITIQTNLSNTMHSRLYIDKEEQRHLLKLFDL
jgi:transposase